VQNLSTDAIKVTDWLTAVSAVLALIMSILALILAKKSGRDSRISAEAAKRSATASESSVTIAERSASIAEKSLNTSVEMFKRQGVIELFAAWEDVKDIDPANPITPNVIRAAQALELTASLWNHNIVSRDIIRQSFWDDFKMLYDKLALITTNLPKMTKSGADLLTRRIRRAHNEMNSQDLAEEPTSDIKA
jgi:hypothetical protein